MQELFQKLHDLLPGFFKSHETQSKLLKKIMKELDTLNANIAAQTAAVVENTTAINNAVAALAAGGSPAEIQKAADDVAANTATVAANTAALNAALTPPQP